MGSGGNNIFQVLLQGSLHCRFLYSAPTVLLLLQVGWVYGSVAEDILTGQRIHTAGWRSALMNINPPAFLGDAPTGGPASLTQYKRWATGLQEIILNRNNPILLCISKHLEFRQCLAYLVLDVWPLRVPFELCYTLLGPYCLLANRYFLPKVTFCHHHIILAETFSNQYFHISLYAYETTN